jgi:predicted transcriptional regulator YheO
MILAPKLKAKKLIKHYETLIQAIGEVFDDEFLLIICAIKCAESTVVEILNVISKGTDIDLFNYWKEVEREIQNFKI